MYIITINTYLPLDIKTNINSHLYLLVIIYF